MVRIGNPQTPALPLPYRGLDALKKMHAISTCTKSYGDFLPVKRIEATRDENKKRKPKYLADKMKKVIFV
jgi:hypothetical protein